MDGTLDGAAARITDSGTPTGIPTPVRLHLPA